MNDSSMNIRHPGLSDSTSQPEMAVIARRPAGDYKAGNDGGVLGIAYVPVQKWQKLYEPDVALERGTLFQELDLPFLGSEGVYNG